MIFLLGGSGYVGSAFRKRLEETGTEFRSVSRGDLDYYNPSELASALRADKATFLINAAGYTGKPNVDACEENKAECLLGNAVLPGRVAEACGMAGVPWGHVSSGCIYTGTRSDGSGFTEEDEPNLTFRQDNCSFYSGCKALGEEVLSCRRDMFVWRLRIPFEERNNPRNYLSKLMMYENLLDATNSITHLREFVDACLACWTERVPFGIYNITNPGHVSTREVVEMIRESGVHDKEYRYFMDEAEFMRTARAPRSNCVLSSAKLESVGINMSPVRDAIRRALEGWN